MRATVVGLLIWLAGPMAAFAAGDAAAGRALAERWCVGCHAAGAAGTDAAPPFTEVARRPGRSEEFFYVWLTDPHPPMPRLDLSRQDIANLIVYLRTLPGAR
jgi:mono/diheme cytochrome c family protein